ncbi:hypothetical protein BH10PSE1_BH10PSE1_22980 [soil metagenome]
MTPLRRSALLVLTVGIVVAGGLLAIRSEWIRDRVYAWSHADPDTASVKARMALLKARQGKPLPPPADHAEALLRCAEAQDLAVSVSLEANVDDARIANDEMRRACEIYFNSASTRSDANRTDHSTGPG